MRKIQKCSPWNNLKTILCSAVFFVSSFVFPVLSAAAAPVAPVVPVVGEALIGLLVALGLIVLNPSDGQYYWTGNGDPYTQSIFEQQAGIILDDSIPIADSDFDKIAENVIAKNTYTTDGTKYYIGNKEITSADLFLQASALAGTSYSMPVNVSGFLPCQTGVYAQNGGGYRARCIFDFTAGTDNYYFPYFVTNSGAYVAPCAINILSNPDGQKGTAFCYNFNTDTGSTYTNTVYQKYLFYQPYVKDNGEYFYGTTTSDGLQYTTYTVGKFNDITSFFAVSGRAGTYNPSDVVQTCLLRTNGRPKLGVIGEKEKLQDAIVKVEPPAPDPEQEPDDKNTPPVPVPPTEWELWRTVDDLLDFVDNGTVSNGGTDYGQYVNNNYNYVQVDVNLPDEVNTNVNLSGNLGIEGSGDIDITFHEDVSLPSGGDGSDFFNPDAADVVDALGKSNPVVSVISGLFAAIDPHLLGVFSVGVSLLVVLGLWKLIRG